VARAFVGAHRALARIASKAAEAIARASGHVANAPIAALGWGVGLVLGQSDV